MKASELRIGNLIQRNGFDIIVGWGTLKAASEGIDIGRPIPLTEEWLVKFGLKKELDRPTYFGEMLYIEYDNGKFNLCQWFDDHGYNNSSTIKKDIQSVHQLQNLYYALTGKELEAKE